MTKLHNILRLMRPKHYIKNLLVFFPLIYSQNFTNTDALLSATVAFVAFCLLASAVYVVNDIVDQKKDSAHPVNKFRPIASGQVSRKTGYILALLLYAIGFLLIFFMGNGQIALFALLYTTLNLAYSFKLKHLPVMDCFCIAAGFVFRIYAGGVAIGEGVSEWLFLTVMATSLFMAFGKRRGEMMQVGESTAARKSLSGYSPTLLNGMVFVFAGLAVVFYALWTMTSVGAMIYTVPLVVFIVCKYLLAVFRENSFGDPISIIFADKLLLIAIAVFGILSFVFLYWTGGYNA
ncbi:MAG: decaprenyl-phosphate phosphoribosyltransferase [Defluviitaleaceae bacterium]|nr:decaprenyl-phosphate phosphoribosyltransferase [Defluviitaleaceae bacterium]